MSQILKTIKEDERIMKEKVLNKRKEELLATMTWLFNLNEEDEEQIRNLLSQYSIRDFFLHIETFELSQQVRNGLENMKNLIKAVEAVEDTPYAIEKED